MGSKYQTTKSCSPNFSSKFSQFEQFKKKTLEIDPEFVFWWFDAMSSLHRIHGDNPEYWIEKAQPFLQSCNPLKFMDRYWTTVPLSKVCDWVSGVVYLKSQKNLIE